MPVPGPYFPVTSSTASNGAPRYVFLFKNKVRKVSRTYQTNLKMDDYVVDRGKDIVTKEFPKGKKTFQAGDEFAPPTSETKSLIGMG